MSKVPLAPETAAALPRKEFTMAVEPPKTGSDTRSWPAYLRLVRLPNAFTAVADSAMGFLLVAAPTAAGSYGRLGLVALASTCLYTAGIAWNDYFDRHLDAVERPERPLPSGKVSPRRAAQLAAGLMAAGVLAGLAAQQSAPRPLLAVGCVLGLAALILAYDWALKPTLLGPWAMGGCRGLNVGMGSLAAVAALAERGGPVPAGAPLAAIAALALTLYVAGLTWFSRSEATRSPRSLLALGTALMLAGLGLLATMPCIVPPVSAARLRLDAATSWPVMLAVLALVPLGRWLAALRRPEPRLVQLAVKHSIMFLIVLDAGLVLAWQSTAWSLVVLALWIPAQWMGRWIPST